MHIAVAPSPGFARLLLWLAAIDRALEAFVGLLEAPSSPAGSPSSQARLVNFCLGRAYHGQTPLLENHARTRPSSRTPVPENRLDP